MNKILIQLTVPLVIAFTGCKKEESAPAAKPTEVTEYSCMIQIKKNAGSEKLEGEGKGATSEEAQTAAMADACGKVAEEDRASCLDGSKWSAATSIMSTGSEDAKVYNANVKLEPKLDAVTGKAKSDKSEEAACEAAVLDACGKAGEAGDCVASGAYVKTGGGSGKETRTTR